MPSSFQVALAQMRVEGGRLEANLQRAEHYIARAVRDGSKLVLLPEALDLGWTHDTAQAGPIPGGTACQALRDAARRHHVHVCAGIVERGEQHTYNAAILVDPAGDILLHHRKLNELEIGRDCYALGRRLAVADTDLGRIGLMICADAFARDQILARSLAWMGAEIILSPCAWAVPADHDPVREPYGALWRDNYQPVAQDHHVWIIGVSNVGWIEQGPWAGRKCIGCSLVVNPLGDVVLQGPYGEDAQALLSLNVQLAPRPAWGDGWNQFLRQS